MQYIRFRLLQTRCHVNDPPKQHSIHSRMNILIILNKSPILFSLATADHLNKRGTYSNHAAQCLPRYIFILA